MLHRLDGVSLAVDVRSVLCRAEHVERDLVERHTVAQVVRVSALHPILIEAHVERPVHVVFDAPMAANDFASNRGRVLGERNRGHEVASLT